MRILLYGINYEPELTGIGKYTGEMAAWLAEHGNIIRVITAPAYYPEWKVHKDFNASSYSKRVESGIEVIRCPLYVPKNLTTAKRLLHLMSFSASSTFPLLQSCFWKPDFVIQVVPTLFCSLQTLMLSKLCRSKSVIHIQDFEIDAMFGLSLAKNSLVSGVIFKLERLLLRQYDYVSTISEGMIQKAIAKGVSVDKIMFLPNWADVTSFADAQPDVSLLKDIDEARGRKIILYSGNMGEKQGLELVVYAAQEMSSEGGLHFLMVGAGAARSRLEKLAKELQLSNISFMPLVDKAKLPGLLALADCHLVVQRAGAADSVMPSKLTNILACGGNAVITANANTSLGRICAENPGIGILTEPDSVAELVAGIRKALIQTKPNELARAFARDCFDKNSILSRFMAALEHNEIDV